MVKKSSKAVHVSGRVGVRAAWEWTCEECGRDSFERSIEVKASEAEIRREFELSPTDEIPEPLYQGSYYCYPHFVRCGHCGCVFETENSDAIM